MIPPALTVSGILPPPISFTPKQTCHTAAHAPSPPPCSTRPSRETLLRSLFSLERAMRHIHTPRKTAIKKTRFQTKNASRRTHASLRSPTRADDGPSLAACTRKHIHTHRMPHRYPIRAQTRETTPDHYGECISRSPNAPSPPLPLAPPLSPSARSALRGPVYAVLLLDKSARRRRRLDTSRFHVVSLCTPKT